MPIYEFWCHKCHRKSSGFVKSIATSLGPRCPFCGSDSLVRSLSSFAVHKSEKTRREQSSPGTPDYYKDPGNIGRWAENRIEGLGLEMPSQVQEMIAAAREGEMPEPIKDL